MHFFWVISEKPVDRFNFVSHRSIQVFGRTYQTGAVRADNLFYVSVASTNSCAFIVHAGCLRAIAGPCAYALL